MTGLDDTGQCLNAEPPDPRSVSLAEWLQLRGTRSGTVTFNGVTYTDLNEVEWREANNVWPPTPHEAFELLLAGNQRFVAGAPEHPNQDAARRTEIAPSQRPFAVLFGCSDSRLAAEIIFDRGLGDLFVVRTAGHVMGAEVLGSIEYGVDVLDCPLVLVLGHDSCGAVGDASAALEDGIAPTGYVRDVVERVTSSVLAARAAGLVEADEILAEHIRNTVDLLLDRSRVLAKRVAAGQTSIVGLCYRLADGSAQVVAARGLDVTADSAS